MQVSPQHKPWSARIGQNTVVWYVCVELLYSSGANNDNWSHVLYARLGQSLAFQCRHRWGINAQTADREKNHIAQRIEHVSAHRLQTESCLKAWKKVGDGLWHCFTHIKGHGCTNVGKHGGNTPTNCYTLLLCAENENQTIPRYGGKKNVFSWDLSTMKDVKKKVPFAGPNYQWKSKLYLQIVQLKWIHLHYPSHSANASFPAQSAHRNCLPSSWHWRRNRPTFAASSSPSQHPSSVRRSWQIAPDIPGWGGLKIIKWSMFEKKRRIFGYPFGWLELLITPYQPYRHLCEKSQKGKGSKILPAPLKKTWYTWCLLIDGA